MDWLMAGSSLILGGVIGFIAGRYLGGNTIDEGGQERRLERLQQELNERQLTITDQLAESQTLLEDVESTVSSLRDKLHNAQFANAQPLTEDDKLTFFGQQAAAHLRSVTKPTGRKQARDKQLQPKDYSGQPSGLLVKEQDKSN